MRSFDTLDLPVQKRGNYLKYCQLAKPRLGYGHDPPNCGVAESFSFAYGQRGRPELLTRLATPQRFKRVEAG
jgi:hypothetical protein